MKEAYGRSLQILLGVCVLVLLIACANVANLLLARAAARRGQTAIRLAWARRAARSSPRRWSSVLALVGALAGLVVAVGAARLLLSLAFAGATIVPIDDAVADGAGIRGGLALVTGILFGAAPAWFATRTDPIEALRGAGRTIGDHSSFARKALLVVQATLSVVLVAGSTLLGRSLNNLEGQDFGFEIPDRVLVAIGRPPADYAPERSPPSIATSRPGWPACRAFAVPALRSTTRSPTTGARGARGWQAGAGAGTSRQGVVGSGQRRLPPAARRETRARPPLHNRRQREVGERRGRQRSVRPRFFKADEDPLDQHFGLNLPKRQHLPHRRRRSRCQIRRLPAGSAGAADVLRPAGADRRLQA